MYSTIPIHWNIKSVPASPGRSLAGPSLYVFSLLGDDTQIVRGGRGSGRAHWFDEVIIIGYSFSKHKSKDILLLCFVSASREMKENFLLTLKGTVA